MQELITKDYNGSAIEFELVDGHLMANATAMCAAFSKRPVEWLRLPTTQRYITALEAKWENPTGDNQLVITRKNINAGTWIHERLILRLAQWLDVNFEIQCDEWVAELLRTGKVELEPILSPAELLLQQCQRLVDHEHRVHKLEVRQDAAHQQIVVLGEKVAEVAARQVLTRVEFYSIIGWASLRKKRMSTEQAKALGKRATALSREKGIEVQKLPSSAWGKVNAYHKSILEEIL